VIGPPLDFQMRSAIEPCATSATWRNGESESRELRQNLTKYLRKVQRGERLEVTERGKPVAVLAPLGEPESPLGSSNAFYACACPPPAPEIGGLAEAVPVIAGIRICGPPAV
jgi:prevent-host-death family protein